MKLRFSLVCLVLCWLFLFTSWCQIWHGAKTRRTLCKTKLLSCSWLTHKADRQMTGRHSCRENSEEQNSPPPPQQMQSWMISSSTNSADSDIGYRAKMRLSSTGPGRNLRNVAYGRLLGPRLIPLSPGATLPGSCARLWRLLAVLQIN